MYEIRKYFEKGQVIARNYHTQSTARIGPGHWLCLVHWSAFSGLLFSKSVFNTEKSLKIKYLTTGLILQQTFHQASNFPLKWSMLSVLSTFFLRFSFWHTIFYYVRRWNNFCWFSQVIKHQSFIEEEIIFFCFNPNYPNAQ